MDEKIFSRSGVDIFAREGRYFIRYDGGGIAVKMREDEITPEEVSKAQKSDKDLYEVILNCQRRSQEL